MYLKNGIEEIQKTHINKWVMEERKISKLERISTESDPGIIVDGWVMKPVDFEEGKKYPAILNIHGGPKSAFGEVFFHEMQYWAGKGYVVFFCNLRGSNVKDNAYSDIRGKYGAVDYKDIMCFTDEVLKKCPYIDEKRLGVTGGSYGGYMTNWIIGHTDRFKAAVSQRSISNWISKFNTTDIGYYWVEDQNKATPWSDVNKLWDHSPVKYADKVKTPTLFIHADEDYRCYFAEGIQMFTALKYHNVESKFCIFKGENHELSRSGKPINRIGRLKEITEWFDLHLKV
ncbi:S9 family peptidase [Oceanirhabdus seepicola]|uniref:S9 family peptidase n=2 Tax=Oceanirhabdus seepicola TaxID=2828781 RepID=A0A9J6P5U7_9CLOT|nr:S9 family peptidase [Oceanirhabdus seepicola]